MDFKLREDVEKVIDDLFLKYVQIASRISKN